jgi:6-phosphogluconolactonase (cycloisomerase 2 family)
VSLSGASSATATTDASGSYSFSGLANGSYTVTPSLTGYTFAPASLAVTVNGADVTGQDFAARKVAHTVGGTVVGLAGTGLVLGQNGGDELTVSANGNFTFATVAEGTSYAITVKTQPHSPSQICAISSGTGTMGTTAVTNVSVACSTNAFKVGGTVTGLVGSGLVLQNNNGDDLAVNVSGTFTFAAPVADGASYAVTVKSQPGSPAQTCTVSNGAGSLSGADVTSVAVTCTTDGYLIGGTVSGLTGTGLVIQDNLGDDLTVPANATTFTFATRLVNGAGYSVSVKASPSSPSQACTVSSGTGNVEGADVTTVSVACTTNLYSIGGNVIGLAGTGLKLATSGEPNLSVVAPAELGLPAPFTFANKLPSGTSYNVSVVSQPTNSSQTCTVTSTGAGALNAADVTNIVVNCATNQYSIGGTVNGLLGSGLGLAAPGNAFLAISAGTTTFTFQYTLSSGDPYVVAVVGQPTGPAQTCTLTNATGTVVTANVTDVAVTCTTDLFSIRGSVTGLTGTGLILAANGEPDLAVPANATTFAFADKLQSGTSYSVSVKAQPPNQVCAVNRGTGTGIGTNTDVTSVAVSCTTVHNGQHSIGGTATGLTAAGLTLATSFEPNLQVPPGSTTFTFSSKLNQGDSYNVSILAQPSAQQCTVTGGAGSVGAADVTNVVVTCRAVLPRFAYVISSVVNTISAYSIDGASGALTRILPDVATGATPSGVAVDPSGRFLYVTNGSDSTVSAYAIAAETGVLTAVGAAVPAGAGPNAIIVDLSGQFLFVSNGSDSTVSAYSIAASTGALTSVGSAVSTTGAGPDALAVHPSGKFLYVAEQFGTDFIGGVSSYQISLNGGALSAFGSDLSARNPASIAVEPWGELAYVVNLNGRTISTVALDPSSGAMASVGTPVNTGEQPGNIVIHPSGRFAYLTDNYASTVSAYAIDAGTGGLAPLGAPLATNYGPNRAVIDPSGRFLYVTASDNTISLYTLDPGSGALTAVSVDTAAVPAAEGASYIVVSGGMP